VLLFPTFSPLGVCPMVTSLFVFSALPFFHFLGPKATHVRGRRCCAVQFSAMGSGGCITSFWLNLGIRLGEASL
jgi:hypothetical protein